MSYLTVLDKYALPALIYMGVLCAYHAIIGSTLFSSLSSSNLIHVDQLCLIGFGIVFFTFHLVYILHFLFKLSKQNKAKAEAKKEAEQSEKINLKKYNSNNSILQ